MAESRDPAIKLFGKTIQIPVGGVVSVTIGEEFIGDDVKVPSTKEVSPEPKDNSEEAATTTEEEKKNDESKNLTNEEKVDRNSSPENSKDDDEHNESSNNPQNKSIKKPDKILPCPRCKSMDTKFCYYNNYNVNQPRHFCKNCQRYWTAGGSMRNVPVGAGRRKSKGSASSQHFRHMTIPDGVQADPESIPHFVEKTVKNRNQNVEEQLSGSSNSNEPVEVSTNSNCYGFPPNVSNLNGSPWPYPWTHPPIALPFYPITAYWNMPWLSNLGKHSREGNLFNHNQSSKGGSPIPEKCLWFPKTTRVDVPENPAAFSRSFTFQESS